MELTPTPPLEIGHFCTKKGDIAAGFSQTQNLPFYVGMIKATHNTEKTCTAAIR